MDYVTSFYHYACNIFNLFYQSICDGSLKYLKYMARKKVLIVLVDALRFDYLNEEDTPFLYSLSQQGLYVKKLTPGYGFCERSEILTGAGPSDTGHFYAYTYAPDLSPFSYLRRFQPFLNLLDYALDTIPVFLSPKGKRIWGKVYKYGRSRLQRWYRKFAPSFSWNAIPFRFFPLFALTEDSVEHTQPDAFRIPSIYDILIANGLSWNHKFQDLATDLSDSYEVSLNRFYQSFAQPHSFYCYAFGHIDSICHKNGTSRENRKKTLNYVDNMAKEMYVAFLDKNPDGYVLFFGDHGMLDIHTTFNAEEQIIRFVKMKGWKVPRDLVYFLDSTTVRFWGKKSIECKELLNNEEWAANGRVLNESLAKKIGVVDEQFNYGDLIWWANPGVCVFPDFFRRIIPPKGMHGYDVNIDEHKGLAILNGPDIVSCVRDNGHLTDIAPTVYSLLDLEIPSQVTGRSWI